MYFAGDTGYAHHFKEINQHFEGFDICLMPVGAYKPKFVMEWAHTSPEEAVQGFHELNGKTFIPMHYGTFDLSDEPASEPVKILKDLKENKQLNGHLKILKVGEELYTGSPTAPPHRRRPHAFAGIRQRLFFSLSVSLGSLMVFDYIKLQFCHF
ncbi:MAG: MBL fold metallo-hydrolase [Sphingobacteriales bacterium]|nr:MBL fold metallo-hydrolase [Sphingobacteriales bacterium]